MMLLVFAAASIAAGWVWGDGDAAANLRAARAASAVDLVGASLGLSVGLLLRERIRLRRAFASPTRSYLGKRLAVAAVVAAAVFAASPVDWPPACLHAFAAAAGTGLALWSGNLPIKL